MERPEVEAVSSSTISFVSQAKLAFEYSLKNLLWKQAAFYAERLVAERPCDETTYLLGLAYFHNQELARAQWHLQGNKLPEARYLLAKCCSQLKRWDLAEEALLPSAGGGNLNEVVNGAAGLFLLGQVQERQGRREQAVECYFRCLQECPFMWEAYERWSWLVLGSPSPSRSSTAGVASSTFSDEKLAQTAAAVGAREAPATGRHVEGFASQCVQTCCARPA
ncbi:CDC27B [Symbiodinium sp. CCMP2592]|nr:CDC27B [Symbiodinium sp. CCMP2592]